MTTAKTLMALGTVSMAPVTIPIPMIVAVPASRRPPVATRPDPMVVAPSPTSSHPNVTRHRTNRWDLYHRNRHGRRHDDWRWGHDDRRRNRDSDVDTETNPGICSSDSHCGQGQNCDSLFHIFTYLSNSTACLSRTSLQRDYRFVRNRPGYPLRWRASFRKKSKK